MNDEVANLVLEQLRAIRADVSDIKRRVTALEGAQKPAPAAARVRKPASVRAAKKKAVVPDGQIPLFRAPR
jgi:DnaJ-domain-containing protein 1